MECKKESSAEKKSRGRDRGRPRLTKQDTLKIRTKIYEVASTLFIEEGYSGVSIRKIAQRVPCSVGVLYKHFDGKREILQGIWNETLRDCFDHCYSASYLHESTWDKLREFSIANVEYWNDNPDYFRMIYLRDDKEKENIKADNDYLLQSATFLKFNWASRLVSEVIKERGGVLDERVTEADLAEAIYTMIHGFCYHCFDRTVRSVSEERKFIEFSVDAILRGVIETAMDGDSKR